MRTKKQEIEAMVKRLAKITGIPYRTDYAAHYGGYNLYYIPEGQTGHSRGKYGFDCRKSTREMYAYMERLLFNLEP